jgi:hypothetical protein
MNKIDDYLELFNRLSLTFYSYVIWFFHKPIQLLIQRIFDAYIVQTFFHHRQYA